MFSQKKSSTGRKSRNSAAEYNEFIISSQQQQPQLAS
jgi:hypothetical protein